MSKKYGNDFVWCFIEETWNASQPVEIWHSLGHEQEEVMAHATDRHNAKQIVDALIVAENVHDDPAQKLLKREMVFLQFVSGNCPEPWSTMADNAILWNDREAFKTIKAKFNEIY